MEQARPSPGGVWDLDGEREAELAGTTGGECGGESVSLLPTRWLGISNFPISRFRVWRTWNAFAEMDCVGGECAVTDGVFLCFRFGDEIPTSSHFDWAGLTTLTSSRFSSKFSYDIQNEEKDARLKASKWFNKQKKEQWKGYIVLVVELIAGDNGI